MTNPRANPVIRRARCDLPKTTAVGSIVLALDRAGFTVETLYLDVGLVRARPGEDSGVSGPLIARVEDVAQGSEMEILLEVGSPAERERGEQILSAIIADIGPSLRGFQPIEAALVEEAEEPPSPVAPQEHEGVTPPAPPPARRGGRRGWAYGAVAGIAVLIMIASVWQFNAAPQGNPPPTPPIATRVPPAAIFPTEPRDLDPQRFTKDEIAFTTELTLQAVRMSEILVELDALLHDRYFYLDKAWRLKMETNLAAARVLNTNLEAMKPPSSMIPMGTALKEAGQYLDEAVKMISGELDYFDSLKVEQYDKLLAKVSKKLIELDKLLDDFEDSRG